MFTIHGGVATGHPLWSVPKQPICNTGSGGTCSGSSYDTVRIARSIGSGITAGLSIGYFPSALVGLSLDDACSGMDFAGGPGSQNDALCQSISGASITMGAVSFSGGVTLRASGTSALNPYALAGAGLLVFSGSTIDMSGEVVQGTTVQRLSIVIDNNPKRFSPVLTFGVGLRVQSAPGYGLLLEIEDLIARFQRLDGPVNALGQGPPSTKYHHHFVLHIGFDVVLERKRGRRY